MTHATVHAPQAAQLGHTSIVRALLVPRKGRRADANAGLTAGPFGLLATESPLAVAAAHGHTETVRALLEVGGAHPDLGWAVGFGVGVRSSPLSHAVSAVFNSSWFATLCGCKTDVGAFARRGFRRSIEEPMGRSACC